MSAGVETASPTNTAAFEPLGPPAPWETGANAGCLGILGDAAVIKVGKRGRVPQIRRFLDAGSGI